MTSLVATLHTFRLEKFFEALATPAELASADQFPGEYNMTYSRLVQTTMPAASPPNGQICSASGSAAVRNGTSKCLVL